MPPQSPGSRRLQGVILTAAHRACDHGLFDTARQLLRVAEELIAGEPDPRQRRRDMEALVAAYERLWELRHPPEDGFAMPTAAAREAQRPSGPPRSGAA